MIVDYAFLFENLGNLSQVSTTALAVSITVVAIIVSVAILFYYPRVPASQVPLRLALALQLGGAVGNLLDRLVQGTVTDFISLGAFPVFNVADASISIGVAVLMAAMWIEERRRRAPAAEEGQDEPPPDSGRQVG